MRRKKTAITQMLEALSDEERLKLFKFVIEVAWDIKCTEAKELWVKQSEQGEEHMNTEAEEERRKIAEEKMEQLKKQHPDAGLIEVWWDGDSLFTDKPKLKYRVKEKSA